MKPWEVSLIKWNLGAYDTRSLSQAEKNRLVHYGPASLSGGSKFKIYRAKLDDKTVLAVTTSSPETEEQLNALDWVDMTPTGRKPLTSEEHRECVIKALLAGMPVPSKILGEYPEVARMQNA